MSSRAPPVPIPDYKKVFRDGLFEGKVLFATGGGSGITKTMVETIMSLGANSVILGRQTARITEAAAELSEKTGKECLPCTADVRKPDQLKEAVRLGVDKFGKIDFVICGAAGNFLAPIETMSENAFKTVIEIDTLGTFNTVKATLPHVKAARGSYLHISTTLHYRGLIYQSHVSAAKAAVDALSAVIAVELGPSGVRSNVIAPGPIFGTPGMDRLSRKDPKTGEMAADAGLREPILGRFGTKEDIACAAVYLFSDAAAWVTGQVLIVDGGEWHMGTTQLPYPQSVLDPESVTKMIKARM